MAKSDERLRDSYRSQAEDRRRFLARGLSAKRERRRSPDESRITSMNKDDIQLLYEYDRWANDRVLRAAAALSAEDFTRDLGGAFHSVRDTLVHIVGSEWGWLTCWKEPSPTSAFIDNLWTRQDAL